MWKMDFEGVIRITSDLGVLRWRKFYRKFNVDTVGAVAPTSPSLMEQSNSGKMAFVLSLVRFLDAPRKKTKKQLSHTCPVSVKH